MIWDGPLVNQQGASSVEDSLATAFNASMTPDTMFRLGWKPASFPFLKNEQRASHFHSLALMSSSLVTS